MTFIKTKHMSGKLALQSNGKNKLLKIVNQSNFLPIVIKRKKKKSAVSFDFCLVAKKSRNKMYSKIIEKNWQTQTQPQRFSFSAMICGFHFDIFRDKNYNRGLFFLSSRWLSNVSKCSLSRWNEPGLGLEGPG